MRYGRLNRCSAAEPLAPFCSGRPTRSESLRRLHLAAQQGDTLFFMLRPLAAAQDASPAALRLSLRPVAGGIEIGFVKRRGPRRDDALFLPMPLDVVGTRAPAARRQIGQLLCQVP